MNRRVVRLSAEGTALVGLLSAVAGFSPARDGVRDEKAIQIVQRCLDAIESGWALSAYDRASRVRAAVNVRGTRPAVGVTANVVMDRPGRRMRIDAAGDVGPLTLLVDRERILLYAPATAQFARRTAGSLAPGAWMAANLAAEVAAIRARLDAGYPLLVYRGREEIGGRAMDVVEDTPEPGATATYWIDASTSLPWRVILSRPGRGDVRLDLTYGNGPRPTAAELQIWGEPSVSISLTPRYDGSGRVSRLQALARTTTSGTLTTDLTFDWSPDTDRGFFDFQPPAGTAEVPFQQLVSGVLLASAGKLGALLQIFSGLG